MSKIKILVLGKTGMLGHIVFDYLKSTKKYKVFAIGREELDALTMSEGKINRVINKYSPDYVINAIGLINTNSELNEYNAKMVNTDFPHLLAYLGIVNGWKLIHISTDCYLDEDVYGRSKFFGEVNDRNNLTIRTSIIGPELNERGRGMFNWFMTKEGEINGFTKNYWDGVTTLQLAKFMKSCIDNNNLSGIIDYRIKKSMDKCQILGLIAKLFNKKIKINKDNRPMKDKRNKYADFWCEKDYEKQLRELKNYMKNEKRYKRYFK